ncbi:MAG TPA: type II secretion system F family protein [Isosphaeraceae bacterium]|nr:type II secretion system F family protein [Isosphaeraceae bacterium]
MSVSAEKTRDDWGENRETLPERPAQAERQFTLVHLMILIACCAVLFSLMNLPGGTAFLAFLLVLGIPATVVAAIVVVFAKRSTQQDSLLWVMALALERRMPLAPGVVAVSDQFGFVFRNRILALARRLGEGVPLPQALALVPGLLPRPVLVLIRLGWETGTLPAAVREATDMRANRRPNRTPLAGKVAYLVGMLMFIQGMGGFLSYFVLPKIESIFADFGVALPEMTMLLVGLTFWVVRSGALAVLSFLEILALLYVPLYYFGWLRLRIPFVGRFARRRHVVVILRGLAVLVESDKPLTTGLSVLARFYPEKSVRRRLARVNWCVEQGGNWWDCLRWQGLVRPAEAAVLASAQRAGNLPWALREIADSGERQLDFRLQIWAQLLFVANILCLGALVFLIVAGYFSPLVTLVERLAP